MPRPPRLLPARPLAALVGVACVATLAVADSGTDWNAVADAREVEVLTTDEDGSSRETTIWLVVLDGQGYIRTSSRTTWGGNVRRSPDIVLRIEGAEYPLRAGFVEDDALRERIVAAFREKYGWFDGFINFTRGARPQIMRLDPR